MQPPNHIYNSFLEGSKMRSFSTQINFNVILTNFITLFLYSLSSLLGVWSLSRCCRKSNVCRSLSLCVNNIVTFDKYGGHLRHTISWGNFLVVQAWHFELFGSFIYLKTTFATLTDMRSLFSFCKLQNEMRAFKNLNFS